MDDPALAAAMERLIADSFDIHTPHSLDVMLVVEALAAAQASAASQAGRVAGLEEMVRDLAGGEIDVSRTAIIVGYPDADQYLTRARALSAASGDEREGL